MNKKFRPFQTVADTQVQLVDAIKIIAEDLRLVARSTNDSLEKHVKVSGWRP